MARFKDLPEEIILSILEYTWETWREQVENHAHLESYMGSPHRSFQSNLLPVSKQFERLMVYWVAKQVRHPSVDDNEKEEWLESMLPRPATQFFLEMIGKDMSMTRLGWESQESVRCPGLVGSINQVTEYLLCETQQQSDHERSALKSKYQYTLCALAAIKLYSGNQDPFFEDSFEEYSDADSKAPERVSMDICSAAGIVAIFEDDAALLTRVLNRGPFCVNTAHEFFGNPILVAAQKGSLECMKILLKEPRRRFITDGAGLNALHIAAIAGDVSMIKLLLENIDGTLYQERQRGLPLTLAAEKGHKTAVDVLLHGLVPRPIADDVDEAIAAAAGAGREGIVRHLWNHSSLPANARTVRDIARLALNDEETVNTVDRADDRGVDEADSNKADADENDDLDLWRLGPRDVPITSCEVDEMFGMSLETDMLLAAAIKDHENIVSLVFDSDVLRPLTRRGVAAACFQAALQHDCTKVAKMLLNRFDGLANEKYGMSATEPLAFAAACTATNVMKLLLERDDIDVNSRDASHSTAICYAMRPPMEKVDRVTDEFEALRLLVAQDKVDVNCADSFGDNALMGAAIAGDRRMVDLLMSREELDVNASNRFGETALSRAVLLGNIDVIKTLLARNDIKADERNKLGLTPFLIAAVTGHVDIMEQFASRPDVDIEAKAPKGRNALWLAAHRGNFDAVKYLIRHSANINVDLNVRDDDGVSPLEAAEGKPSAKYERTVLILTGKCPTNETAERPSYINDDPASFLFPFDCCVACELIHPKAHGIYFGQLPGFSDPSCNGIDLNEEDLSYPDDDNRSFSDFSVSDFSSSDDDDGKIRYRHPHCYN
ncbi:hypothetical protein H101_03301 [Trichophyton interdigitale H6]|nr:hypothetical protein H101_03301 [Trichophyton interdigitale H6]